MVYLNPDGFNFGPKNWDGYGISNIVWTVTYAVFFYSACIYVWLHRRHPILRIRNVPMILLSLLTLHVFLFMIFVVYTLNGAFPCQVEFWIMSLYLPIGIGLFQAQNQQLSIVSRQQAEMLQKNETYRLILPKDGKGIGSPRYWVFRFKNWWRGVSVEHKYQGYVFIGIVVQFIGSFIIYNISRKFVGYGVVSHHTSPGLCRRGWEWAPSVIWQFLWNFFFGPYQIWKIRMVRDIYHWRLQTILAIVAGLPGTPIWLASVYTDSFASVNKYWIPAMWFVPGLMTMEIVTLGFPIYQIIRSKKAARATQEALQAFEQKKLDGTSTDGSITTRSTNSKGSRGKMYSMESLDECLNGNHDALQVYASYMELNGENIIFLTKVLAFQQRCAEAFHASCTTTREFTKARAAMFRIALSIYVSLIHTRTAPYPINIESPIYARLDAIFGPATAIVASGSARRASSISTPVSDVTPWDAPSSHDDADPASGDEGAGSYPLTNMRRSSAKSGFNAKHLSRKESDDSMEHGIVANGAINIDSVDGNAGDSGHGAAAGVLETVKVPADFDERVFDSAWRSVRFMVWSETWQRFRVWQRSSDSIKGFEAFA